VVTDPEPRNYAGGVFYTQCPVVIGNSNAPDVAVDVVEIQGRMPRTLLQQVVLLAGPVPYLGWELREVRPKPPVSFVA
jgi:hypothetical protein